jgi:Cof subfamily protein (haloacid dehalogenase superfamily)
MSMLIDPLKLDTPISGFNGGVMTAPDLSVIETHALNADAAKAALDMILGDGLDAWVYTATDWIIRDPAAAHVAREAWTVKFDAVVKPAFSEADLAQAVKIVGVSDDLDKVAACETKVSEALGKGVSARRSQPYYLDVTDAHANKGAVVTTLSKRLQIPAAEIATMGDMPNDTLMFDVCGLSIAMGNASDAVKAKATRVTASNEADGFAHAVGTFILPRAPGRVAA